LNMPFGELDFEKITALQPDLIIGVYSGFTEEEYNTLSKIAPTVAQSGGYIDFGMPWQEQTRMIGRTLGRTEQAEQMVAGVRVVTRHRRAPPARLLHYPVYSKDYQETAEMVLSYLGTFQNLWSLGRGGSFFYGHVHDFITDGFSASHGAATYLAQRAKARI
jgi:hypothetical protein